MIQSSLVYRKTKHSDWSSSTAKQPFWLADMTNSDRPSATSSNIPHSHRPSQSVAVCQDWAQNFTYWHRIAQMLQSSKTTLRQYGDIANLTLHPVAQIEASLAIEFESNKWRISGPVLRPVLLASRDEEQRWFGGRRDLDYSAPRVRWLRTPLCRKAEAQGTRPSKPEKKGTRPIGNTRGIAVRVGRLLSGSGKALNTFLCPLHESGLVEGKRM